MKRNRFFFKDVYIFNQNTVKVVYSHISICTIVITFKVVRTVFIFLSEFFSPSGYEINLPSRPYKCMPIWCIYIYILPYLRRLWISLFCIIQYRSMFACLCVAFQLTSLTSLKSRSIQTWAPIIHTFVFLPAQKFNLPMAFARMNVSFYLKNRGKKMKRRGADKTPEKGSV